MTPPRAAGVRLLWFHDWYDGPVSGLAEWEGVEYWFDLDGDIGDLHDAHPRPYVLRRLTAAELAAEWDRHREFERAVGPETCADHDGVPPPVDHDATLAARWAYHDAQPYDPQPYRDRPAVAAFER